MKISKDWVEAYFEYGVDVQNRCIFLSDDVNETSIGNVIKGLYLMEADNSEKPIEVRIMSYGGDIFDMFGLHDVTRTLKCPVHTMGMGKVMSAAILLLACGERGQRWAGPNTGFMIHIPSMSDEDGKTHEIRSSLDFTDLMWKRWYELMEKYTNKPISHWKRLCAKNADVYFTADEALEWGLIDHMWDEKDGEE